jgi:hypothetical protein
MSYRLILLLRCTNLFWKISKEQTSWRCLSVDGRVILKCIVNHKTSLKRTWLLKYRSSEKKTPLSFIISITLRTEQYVVKQLKYGRYNSVSSFRSNITILDPNSRCEGKEMYLVHGAVAVGTRDEWKSGLTHNVEHACYTSRTHTHSPGGSVLSSSEALGLMSCANITSKRKNNWSAGNCISVQNKTSIFRLVVPLPHLSFATVKFMILNFKI